MLETHLDAMEVPVSDLPKVLVHVARWSGPWSSQPSIMVTTLSDHMNQCVLALFYHASGSIKRVKSRKKSN